VEHDSLSRAGMTVLQPNFTLNLQLCKPGTISFTSLALFP